VGRVSAGVGPPGASLLVVFSGPLMPGKCAHADEAFCVRIALKGYDGWTGGLEKILATGGSSWAVGVGGGRNGLVARMPSSVVDVVAAVTSASDGEA
jgi:hypothetical protein